MEQCAPPERDVHDFGKCPLCYVGEIGPYLSRQPAASQPGARGQHPRHEGQRDGAARPHADAWARNRASSCRRTGSQWTSHGDIYVGEVVVSSWPSAFPGKPVPPDLKSLQKLEKVSHGTGA